MGKRCQNADGGYAVAFKHICPSPRLSYSLPTKTCVTQRSISDFCCDLGWGGCCAAAIWEKFAKSSGVIF